MHDDFRDDEDDTDSADKARPMLVSREQILAQALRELEEIDARLGIEPRDQVLQSPGQIFAETIQALARHERWRLGLDAGT